MRLHDKVTLLTGASRGMGRALALGIAREGSDLALVARNEQLLEEVADEVRGLGRRAIVLTADVSDPVRVKEVVQQTRQEFGRIDILVNNAGVLDNEPIANHSDEAWNRIMGINLFAPFYFIREVIGEMTERKSGRILVMASTSAKISIGPNRAAYVASKHGVLGLVREVAQEAAPFGVTVNAICPGAVLTDMVRDSIRMMARDLGKSEADVEAEWKGRNPQKRLLDPEEVVPQSILLISDEASGITGQAINVNGGSMMV
jgi:NAD(P)-dependent dehydrogenase (short-subunit alcohol dehydrogenase family)